MKIILIDTNLYLDDPTVIYKLANAENKILIPLMVLKELDKHKFNRDLSYSARCAIRSISEFMETNPDRLIFDNNVYRGEPDERILISAKTHNATVATKDISMSIQAKAQNIDVLLYGGMINNIFDPYINLHMNDFNRVVVEKPFDYGAEYNGDDYDETLNLFSKVSGHTLDRDYWWFVIIDINTTNKVIYANHPLENKIIRIDNRPKYRKLTLDKNYETKALDDYQVCAIYAMIEAPNTIICGSYGSGKSLLSTAYSLAYNDNKKTFISRPNLTVDHRFALGFLPGSLEEKLAPWMAGVISSLYNIYSNTKGQVSDKMNSDSNYDYVKEYLFKKHFEMISLETIQGISFMKDDLVLLDEAQLCSIAILSTILSRFGKGSKLIITGDLKQTYDVIKPSENGLLKLLRLLPNKYMAYVTLKNHYRSELIELATALQDKSF